MASINDRLSLVFGSLNATLKPVDDPPWKEDPHKDDVKVTDGHKDRKRRHHHDHDSKSFHPSRHNRDTTRSRDRSPHSFRRRQPAPPDYMKHPGKWTKYDLEGDGSDQSEYKGLSDEQVNKKAALDFIHKLRQQKTTPTESLDDTSSSDDKIVFKKPTNRPIINRQSINNKPTINRTELNEVGHCQGTVHKMPEYFVGLSPSKPTIKKSTPNRTTIQGNTSIQLTHLEQDDDDV